MLEKDVDPSMRGFWTIQELQERAEKAEAQAFAYNGVVAHAQAVLQEHYRHPDRPLRLDHLERALDEATPDWRETLCEPSIFEATYEPTDTQKKHPWGYGPMDSEGNYPDELQYYDADEKQ